jgi:hypothetical protein
VNIYAPDTDRATYAWRITRDILAEGDGDGFESEVGVTGPRNAPPELLTELDKGHGRAFRIYDDDGEHYYTGRIVFSDDEAGLGDEAFGPLWDFGAPNAGATEIRYCEAGGRWVTL